MAPLLLIYGRAIVRLRSGGRRTGTQETCQPGRLANDYDLSSFVRIEHRGAGRGDACRLRPVPVVTAAGASEQPERHLQVPDRPGAAHREPERNDVLRSVPD